MKINLTISFLIVLGNLGSYFLTLRLGFLLVEKVKNHRINFAPEFFHSQIYKLYHILIFCP